ncbi:MAG: hypothetical protein ABIH28_03270 [archaeon]
MVHLNNIFSEEGTCSHRFPDIEFIADLLDRDRKEVRAYFCFKCRDYRWKYPETKKLNEYEILELKRDKYFLYCTLESLTSLGTLRRK